MRAALGDDFLRDVPSDRRARMRSAPVVVLDLFRGIAAGHARVSRGIPFAAPEGVRLTLDVYQPPVAGRYPSVVQIYGGAWQRGAPGDDAAFATYLAARGYVVFAIDYRHAPRWQWPAQIEDVAHGARLDSRARRRARRRRRRGSRCSAGRRERTSPCSPPTSPARRRSPRSSATTARSI